MSHNRIDLLDRVQCAHLSLSTHFEQHGFAPSSEVAEIIDVLKDCIAELREPKIIAEGKQG